MVHEIFEIVIILLMLWAARRKVNVILRFGVGLQIAGIACNLAALLFNHGSMPVILPNVYDRTALFGQHQSFKDVLLAPLCDIFQVGRMVISVGDMLIAAGLMVLIVAMTLKRRRNRRRP
jgi:lipoprotein signal peptidase